MATDNANPGFFEKANKWIKNSVSLRLVTIGILLLLMLIPIDMVQDIIRERQYRQEDAINEVSQKWGLEQTVKGLVLTVPYHVSSKVYDEDEKRYKIINTRYYAHFLPEQLNIEGEIKPEVRYRGMYEVIVYNSTIDLNGYFNAPDFSEWKIEDENILWDEAFVSLGLSDLRSIQENVKMKWGDETRAFNPGIETSDVVVMGMSSPVNFKDDSTLKKKVDFSLALDFNGSSSLNFVPLGKETNVNIKSAWKDPKFGGAFLPDDRTINKSGFTAEWKVLHLNRPYPQQFKGATTGIDESSFGVNLYVPVDQYQKSTRAAKYAVLFIALTFLIFFFIQILNKIRIHPIQYILVGLALCVFYTLLISFSEHINFNLAYLIATIAIVGTVTGYAKAMFKKTRLTTLTGLILLMLYGFIFTIIQLEDFSLLIGSIGLFLVLALVMYLSRKVDWYAIGENNKPS